MRLCAITDRQALAGTEEQRADSLVALAAAWARKGVDYIQLREKDLSATELEALARRIVEAVRANPALQVTAVNPAKVLINGNDPQVATIAINAAADGVHLTGNFTPRLIDEVRRRFASGRVPRPSIISVAVHSIADVERAREAAADMLLFAPVFEKVLGDAATCNPGTGLQALANACAAAGPIPVLALGGVTAVNAPSCIAVGAAGIAAIRLAITEFAGLQESWYPDMSMVP